MPRICLLLAAASAKSGRMLAQAIGARARYTPTGCDVLIRYGSARASRHEHPFELNTRDAVSNCTDKLKSLEIMDSAGITVPRVMFYPDVELPALGRRRRHTRGLDIIPCRMQSDIEHAHASGSDYFTQWIRKDREYRIHVFAGRVIKANVKQPHPDWSGDHSKLIRSLQNGWRFREVNPNIDPSWDEVLVTSIHAVESLDLDFGAVDIVRDNDGRLYVLEVNSAPALASPLTLQAYTQAIRSYIRQVTGERRITDEELDNRGEETNNLCARYSA